MKKFVYATLAAGFVIASASAASALTYDQSTDLGAYEKGGIGAQTQMQIDHANGRHMTRAQFSAPVRSEPNLKHSDPSNL